ncbi:hypothetical protein OIV83_006008 [Microbotryomycetes sp. JL201]|nr:hypothetical protein OIV83_006008 [Microbotryomycetes sp. JL201]
MGLFSKSKLTKPAPGSQQQSQAPPSQRQYAPPPGPPPPSASAGYGQAAAPQHYGGYQQPQQYGGGGGYQQPTAMQQQYSAPPGPPPPHPHTGQQYGAPPPPAARPGREDPLASLSKYDTVFLVDDSGSMEMFWEDSLRPALAQVIDTASRYDSDGVDICFMNDRTRATSKSSREIMSLFQRVWPSKSTPTASAMRRVIDPYLSELRNWQIEGKPAGYPRPKPMNLIILTDGEPDRGESPEPVIVETARSLEQMRMPPYQLGIQFVQIGSDDEAARFLQSLDDDLREKYGIRDMVDTTLFDSSQGGEISTEYLMKALLGGINKSVDNQN